MGFLYKQAIRVCRRARRGLLACGLLRVPKDVNHLKWGIVGTGYMASVWADTLLNSRIGILESVCSRDINRAKVFSRRWVSNNYYSDLDKMLSEKSGEMDCIYIATPLNDHFMTIKKCICAGFNVLTEKPATESPDEWAQLISMSQRHGVFLAEGMWMRCLPTFSQAEEWVAQGEIGSIRSIKANLQKFSPRQGDLAAPGVLMDYGVYALHMACFFLGGQPQSVTSRARRDQAGRDVDWAIVAERDGVTALINISSDHAGRNDAAVIGDKGVIAWGSPFNRTNRISLRNLHDSIVSERFFDYRSEGFEHQLLEVSRCIRCNLIESPLLSQEMTMHTLHLAQILQANAEQA